MVYFSQRLRLNSLGVNSSSVEAAHNGKTAAELTKDVAKKALAKLLLATSSTSQTERQQLEQSAIDMAAAAELAAENTLKRIDAVLVAAASAEAASRIVYEATGTVHEHVSLALKAVQKLNQPLN